MHDDARAAAMLRNTLVLHRVRKRTNCACVCMRESIAFISPSQEFQVLIALSMRRSRHRTTRAHCAN
jgi:hypothetical protein